MDKFDTWNKRKYNLNVNGWEPAVYMSYISQNFRLFHVSNLSILILMSNFSAHVGPGSVTSRYSRWGWCRWSRRLRRAAGRGSPTRRCSDTRVCTRPPCWPRAGWPRAAWSRQWLGAWWSQSHSTCSGTERWIITHYGGAEVKVFLCLVWCIVSGRIRPYRLVSHRENISNE